MERTPTKQKARPVFRLLRPFWWVAHAATGWKLLAVLFAGSMIGTSRYEGCKIHDINNLRNLAGYLQLAGREPVPLAPDGRLDVYIFVRTGEIEGEHDLKVYASKETGQQPTLEEMLAGDYSNFAYERFRGEVSANDPATVPLLWDKQPRRRGREVGRVVGLTGGRAVFMEEAELQALLRAHGQLDLPEGP